MVEFSSQVLRVFIMTINNKSERSYRGKCLGSPVTSYGGEKGNHISIYSPALVKSYMFTNLRVILAT